LNAELISNLRMHNGECSWVVKRARGPEGEPIGCAHNNPLFETCKYDVEYTNGLHEWYQANVIAENMYAKVDNKGWQYQILEEIINNCKDNTAVLISDGMVHSANGELKPKVTMFGQYHLCTFNNGLMD
jgi:hypothetical protein